MAFDYDVQDGFLWITVTEVFTGKEASVLVAESGGLVDREGIDRILIDYRNADVRFDTLPVYDTFTRTVATERSLYRVRTAAVFSPSEDARDIRFVENVAVNYGLSYRAFTDADAAKQWLFDSSVSRRAQR